jgi:hypothetical protein
MKNFLETMSSCLVVGIVLAADLTITFCLIAFMIRFLTPN